MSSNFRSDKLEEAIHDYDIYLEDDIKWDNEKMIKRLGDFFISLTPDKYSWGARYVQSLGTPMLCRHLKEDIKHFKHIPSPTESEAYIAENKVNGFRCVACYSPEKGFEFFSRRESSSDFLNGNFTDKFLFINNGLISEPHDYVNSFNYRFVIDGELIVESSEMGESLTMEVSIEDYIQGVLGSSPERAKAFQRDGHKLKMIVFDVLYFEKSPAVPAEWTPKYEYRERELTPEAIQWVEKHFESYLKSAGFMLGTGKAKKLYQYLYTLKDTYKYDIRKYPFYKRRQLRGNIVNFLRSKNLPFFEVEYEDTFKTAFTDTILREGGEGCFKSTVSVTMADGSFKKMKDICEGDMVLSYNINKRELEPKKVLRKIDNGLRDISDWVSVSHGIFQGAFVANKQNRFKRIICTKNHNFYNGHEYEPVENMSTCFELGKKLDSYRYQALLGWLLSDGSVDKNGVISLCQRYDSDYWKYTVNMFAPFTSKGEVRPLISGKGSKIGTLTINKEYCLPFTSFRENKIPYISQMNEIAFAYLIVGDGSKNKDALELSVHSLCEHEVQALLNQVVKIFGDIKYSLKKDKRVKHGSGLTIRIWTESAKQIKQAVCKYVHPSMRYKLGECLNEPFIYPVKVEKEIKEVPILKTPFSSYENAKRMKTIRAWDLEVEDNHNFFVENVLVHNSILKNKYAPYISGMRSSRSHRAAMKVKQSIANMLNSDDRVMEDFDVFITGANPPKSERITDMIGSLSCSIYIKDDEGNVREHEIANVSGISHEWKRRLACVNVDTGKIELNPEYKDKVISINGLALTGTNLKFQHATLKTRGTIEFKAKNPTECTWDEATLREMAIIRGK